MNNNHEKNELLQFLGGLIMLAVGLFIFSNKVMVSSNFFGTGGISILGYRMNTGLVIVPLIIGIVWMFVSGGSFLSKLFTTISVLFIIAAVIMNTNIRLVTITLYEWVLILVLIFGGGALVAKISFAYRGEDEDDDRPRRRKKTRKTEEKTYDIEDDIDEQLERLKKQ